MNTYNDKIILITGSTDGLGKQVALDLANQGMTVLLHGRNQSKGDAVLREIRSTSGNRNLVYYNADLASLDAVRQLSEDIRSDQKHLDVLVNNAGIGAGPRGAGREQSKDGYELRFAVNYLAPFLLTHRLLPLLKQSKPSRIVNVASVGQQPIDFNDVMLEFKYDGLRAYRQSKLAQVMFSIDLARRLQGSDVSVNSLHPASLMNTRMVIETNYFGSPMTTVEEGAQAVEYLAVGAELEGISGEYYEGKHPARAVAQAYNEKARSDLWTLSEQLVGLNITSD